MNSAPDQPEVRHLEESLRLCRLELAQRHAELETLLEERADLVHRCDVAETLASDLQAQLNNRSSSRNPRQRVRSALQQLRHNPSERIEQGPGEGG